MAGPGSPLVPTFYARDAAGIPRAWVTRGHASMAKLAPRFSSNRMLRQYVDDIYLPAADAARRRSADAGRVARELHAWATGLAAHWAEVRIDAVELYAEPLGDDEPVRIVMDRTEQATEIQGGAIAPIYRASVPASRPASDYTPRIVPHHPEVRIPMEAAYVRWPRCPPP